MNSFDPNRWDQRRRQDAWIAKHSSKPVYRPKKSIIPYAIAPWVVIGCLAYVIFS